MQGFYTVYREVFAKLAKLEDEAAEKSGSTAPRFGMSASAWPEVSAFYQHWQHFVSDQDFDWADVHNLASAPNRKASMHKLPSPSPARTSRDGTQLSRY